MLSANYADPSGGRQEAYVFSLTSEKLFEKKRDSGYYSLAPELRREVMRCHRHLGHMPPDQLARVLADAGAKLEVVQWTKRHFECPVCRAEVAHWVQVRVA